MKPRIVFVDDQPEVLDGLRRVLRSQRDNWNLEYCHSGKEALDSLTRSPIDLLVTDMRMPGMDGAQLCQEVSVRSPQTIRLVLTGQSSSEQIMRAFGMAHRCLAKPCSSELLIQTLNNTLALQQLISSPPLQAFLADITALPTMPEIFAELMTELLRENPDMKRAAELVSTDMAVSCRVLQLVNSSYFGLRCRVDSPAHAAQLLGLERLKGLVLTSGLFAYFQGVLPPGINIDALQESSLKISLVGGRIMRAMEPQSLVLSNRAVVAGVVHDIGQLVLLQNRPHEYGEILNATRDCPERLCDEELKRFGVTHAMVGAHLLNLWGMDSDVVNAVAHHHDPESARSSDFSVLTALHVAEGLTRELDSNLQWPFGAVLNTEYVNRLVLSDRLEAWREIAQHSLEGRQQ